MVVINCKSSSPPTKPVDKNVEEDEDEIICTHLVVPLPGGTRRGGNKEESELGATDLLKGGLIASATGVGVPTVATGVLTGVGFGGSGIVGGSIAAGIQSGIGSVAAGSTFATLQSIGATGGFAVLGPVGLAGAAIGGLGYLGIRLWENHSRKQKLEEERRKLEAKRRREEDVKYLLKILLNDDDGRSGYHLWWAMCAECQEKLLIKIHKKFKNTKNSP